MLLLLLPFSLLLAAWSMAGARGEPPPPPPTFAPAQQQQQGIFQGSGAFGRVLTPPYFNLAEGRLITATSTCGYGVSEPELYCKLVGAHADQKDNPHVNLIQGQVCDYCDPDIHNLDHAPGNAIDGTERWWQSPPLSRGTAHNSVNLTIDLGQEFHVAYVFIKMANSPRPGIWALERSTDHGKTWEAWQYFADTYSDCVTYFGKEVLAPITRDDSVVCETKFSKVVPLEGGEIVVSLLNDRPSANNFYNSSVLQEWTKATNIRLRLIRTKTLLGHLMSVARQDPTVTRRYYYSIRDISIGGRCVCNGHAENCDITDPEDRYKLLCRCQHNTCGSQCDQCCPGFVQKKWRPATIFDTNECEACNCFNHSDECEYDEKIDEMNASLDIAGIFSGGGVCQNCRHNTEGINCNQCKPGFYRPYGKPLNATDVCQPCSCDSFYSTGSCDEGSGRCECREEFLPPLCDQCNVGFYGYPDCRPCDCHLNGTRGFVCEVGGGQCPCKLNYIGKNCDQCTEGYYGFPSCFACECDIKGSLSVNCDAHTGQCVCGNNYGGRTCSVCDNGFFGFPTCEFCNCDHIGCVDEICDKSLGECLCKEGYAGERCDRCLPGFFGYPNCRSCGCNQLGSVGNTCDESGKCQCLHNFAGLTCHQCLPGYYNYPDCFACNCELDGAIGVSCDQEGRCQCKPNFDGSICNSCKKGFYNYPSCEECNCNPAGILSTFAGCGTLTTGELCQCKERVGGRTCHQCRALFWNLQASNPLGCEECNCHQRGTIGGISVCDGNTGQCLCKPNAASRRCDDCQDGTYSLQEENLFGCIDCECDIGGAVNKICDKLNGQCACRPRISGRKCNQPLQLHYFPTLYQHQYEIEDGHSPSKTHARFGYSNETFPGYSWRGYAVFSPLQREVRIRIFIDKPSIYRVIVRYLNNAEDAVIGNIMFTPDSIGSEIQQSSAIKFEAKEQPALVTVSGADATSPSHFVLNPGWWTVAIKIDGPILVDYFILLPAAYYEATLLHETVNTPCRAQSETNICRHYSYPFVEDFANVRGEVGYVAEGDDRKITQLYVDYDLVEQLGSSGEMARLNDSQRDVRMDLFLPKAGRYVLVILYYTPNNNKMTSVFVDTSSMTGRQKGRALLYDCKFSMLCRQAVTDAQGRIIVFNFDQNFITLQLKVAEEVDVAIDMIVAIPAKQWHMDYISPQTTCLWKNGTCINSKFHVVPGMIKVECETGNEDRKAVVFPHGLVHKDVGLIHLDHKDATVDVHGRVPSSGQYVFVIHYFQPHHPEFNLDVLIQNGQYYEGQAAMSFCPSSLGCRSVIRAKNGENKFGILENFHIMLKEPNNKGVWVDYVLVIPIENYKEEVLKEMPLDKAVEFITMCGQHHFYIDPQSSPEEFCKEAIFSLTAEYNNGGLACQCNFDGSLSFECDKFGGQCFCRPNVIGRSCSECRTGYFGFPDCKPCSCPSTAVCHPDSGECICPPRVTGEKCESCLPHTYGFDPIIGCEECNCNPLGVQRGELQCDHLTGQCNCQSNVVSRTCDQCQAGYWSFPFCQLCDCDLRGTTDDICDMDTSHCFCKDNVYGPTCDQCKPGTFHLEEKNPMGCTKCFCFGRTDRCSSSGMFRFQISESTNWTSAFLRAGTGTIDKTASSLAIHMDGKRIYVTIPKDVTKETVVYFSAPFQYLGRQVGSYGGILSYTIKFSVREGDNAPLIVPDVILVGNNMTVGYEHFEQPVIAEPLQVEVVINEHNFYHLGGGGGLSATREQLMTLLNNLEAIYIRGAYFVGTKETSIKRILLDTATSDYLADAPLALSVEQCHCPPNYQGLSCEDCAPGYYRSQTGLHGGYCIPCECNGHSPTCDPLTGKCKDCRHNTTGDHCETCAIGYHGDATSGTPYDCLICACPLPIPSNNFAVSCEFSPSGLEIRCKCQPGYYGPRCEYCAAGFYGHPEIQGEVCKPCECSGNIDSSSIGSCDSQTGECLQCLNNTYGEACNLCAPGFYGDAIDSKDCARCSCDDCGTRECHHGSGLCKCHPNVVGDRCNACAPGFWNFDSCLGCVACNCEAAAEGNQCNILTGQCTCKEGVMGRNCDQCKPGFWNYRPYGCQPCRCNIEHSIGGSCNPQTGRCECLPGVIGDQCNQCPHRWILIENVGCQECGTCVHVLLDDTDVILKMLDPVVRELEGVSIAYFAYQRLNHINKTVSLLRPVVDLLIYDPSAVDLRPLERQLTNLERDSKHDDREANNSVNNAIKANKEADELRKDALELEKMIRDTVTNVEGTVQYIRDLAHRIVSGHGPDVDRKISEAESLLRDINRRNFDHATRKAKTEDRDANDTLARARYFAQPVEEGEEQVEELKFRLADIEKKLQQLMNLSADAHKKAGLAKSLADVEKYSQLKARVATAEDALKNIKGLLDSGRKLIGEARDLLTNAKNTFANVFELTAETLKQQIERLRKKVYDLTENLDEVKPDVDRAKDHAQKLEDQAKRLDGLLANTRQTSENAVKAANSYGNIVEAINEALRAAEAAVEASNQAQNMSDGMDEKAEISKTKSKDLLKDAILARDRVRPSLMNRLEEAKLGVDRVSEANKKTSQGLDWLNGGMDRLSKAALVPVSKQAANISNAANKKAKAALKTVQGILTQLPEDIARAKQVSLDILEAKKAIKLAHTQVEKAKNAVPEVIRLMAKMQNRTKSLLVLGVDVSKEIEKLRQKVALARDAANRIKLGVEFGPNSVLQLHNPEGLGESASYTKISLYLKTKQTDGLIVYLGNEEGTHHNMRRTDTDDYMSLSIENKRAKLTLDMGSGFHHIVNNRTIADNEWHKLTIEKTGNYVQLIVSTEGEKDQVNEKPLTDIYSVFNLDQELSKFFVGGVPDTAKIQGDVNIRHFEGCIEDLTFEDNPVGLWHFVEARDIGGCAERDKLVILKPSSGLRFDGNGYAIMPRQPAQDRFQKKAEVILSIRTFASDGLLFLIGRQTDYFAVELRQGQVYYHFNLGSGQAVLQTRGKTRYDDGQWYQIEARRHGKEAILKINGDTVDSGESPGVMEDLAFTNNIYFGGYPGNHSFRDVTNIDFEGCIEGVQIGSTLRDLNKNKEALGVVSGCPAKVARTISFGADTLGYVAMPGVTLGSRNQFTFKFKTQERKALLLYTGDDNFANYVSLSLLDGNIVFRIKPGGEVGSSNTSKYNDLQWHYVSATWDLNDRKLILIVDDFEKFEQALEGHPYSTKELYMYVGGLSSRIQIPSTVAASRRPFVGCIGDMTVDGVFQNFANSKNRTGGSFASCPLGEPVPTFFPRLTDITVDDYEYEPEIVTSATARTKRPETVTRTRIPITSQPVVHDQCVLSPHLPSNSDLDAIRFGLQTDSHQEYHVDPSRFRTSTNLTLEFKTSAPDGVLFYFANAKNDEYIGLFIQSGKLFFSFDFGRSQDVLPLSGTYNDGKWHTVKIDRFRGNIEFTTDLEKSQRNIKDEITSLASPLYVGGLSRQLATSLDQQLRGVDLSLDGCIRNLRILEESVEPSQSVNTGTCSDAVENGHFFSSRGGYIALADKFRVGKNRVFDFEIKPRSNSGVIMAVWGKKDFLVIQLTGGNVSATVDNGRGMYTASVKLANPYSICDGKWHKIQVAKYQHGLSVVVGEIVDARFGPTGQLYADTTSPLYVGGVPENVSLPALTSSPDFFVGCIRKVQIDQKPEQLEKGKRFGGVTFNVCPST